MRAFARAGVIVAVASTGCFSPHGSSPTTEVDTGGTTTTTTSTSTSATTSTSTSGEPTTGTSAAVTATSVTSEPTSTSEPATGTSTGVPSTGGTTSDEPACGDGAVDIGEDCDDGNNVEGDGCFQCMLEGLNVRYVFVTSTKYTGGQVQKLTAADGFCNTLAGDDFASTKLVGRKFVAWLSDGSTHANTRIGEWELNYLLPDDTLVAAGSAGLTSGALMKPIAVDEKGLPVPIEAESCQLGSDGVWTGTRPDGVADPLQNCTNWTSDTEMGLIGSMAQMDGRWTKCATRLCTTPFRLYCVETQ